MAQRKIDNQENVIVKLIDDLLNLAAYNNASDIHLEPEIDKIRVRFRIDGVLRQVEDHPLSMHESLLSRLKVVAGMDIAENRKPQEGRFQQLLNDRDYDIRVSIFPTVYGQNVALRLLDKASVTLGLDSLGFESEALLLYQKMIKRPYGVIFVTGPNGSGKTTTLYSTLAVLNSVEKNIVTLEDPVEYQLEIVRQTEVDPSIGVTFANGLKMLLRQDPDIVMVGEIRDRETAEIAVRAALTGHLVLTTLHTNDSVASVARLVDMGIEPVLLASATIGIIAQRLVRLVCQNCAEHYEPTPELLKQLNVKVTPGIQFAKAKGCTVCGMTGYQGRIGIYEVLQVDDEMRNLIITGAAYETMVKLARAKGMRTLRESGLAKVAAGLTSLEEVLRVTSAGEGE